MRIIREGNLHHAKYFKCKECGCLFEADDTEYEEAPWTAKLQGFDCRCKCPCCGKWVVLLQED